MSRYDLMRASERNNSLTLWAAGTRRLCIAAILCVTLPGCVGLATGVGAVVGTAALQERGVSGAFNDTIINGKIAAIYLEKDVNLSVLGIKVHEGDVLLTGTVPTIKDRIEAVRYAWQVDGVRTVISEIEIADSSGLLDVARDTWVTTQLRLRITFDGHIQAINYGIDTVNGTVYLMGVAQNSAELSRVRDHARELSYVRRIISHVRIKHSSDTG